MDVLRQFFSDEVVRFLCSFETGALLSLTGSIIQGVTQNELASSSTLGFDAYVVLIILIVQGVALFVPELSHLPLEIVSLGLFFLSVLLGRFFAFFKRFSISFFLLLGLSFNLFVGMVFSLLQFIFMTFNHPFPSELWSGQFRFADPLACCLLSVFFIMIYLWSFRHKNYLWAVSFGEDFCFSQGLFIEKTLKYSLFLSFMAQAVVICFFGVFSFLGLILPHLWRRFPYFRYDLRRELVVAPFLSGLMLSGLDALCFYFPWRGAEVPVGLLSGVIGPFMLLIILVGDGSGRRR